MNYAPEPEVTQDIAIVDSGGANIASVKYALERLGVNGALTADPEAIRRAHKVILPGVGAAGDAMARLQAQELIDCLRSLSQPVLGICLGMQLLYQHSAEGDVDLLGLLAGEINGFDPAATPGPVPHMGWHDVSFIGDHPLLAGIADHSYFYFVHGYYAPVTAATIGTCSYGTDFAAIVARDNVMGCQFHPERSGAAGAQLLDNFLRL
jgi:glutamine amidotransferase